jgi:hypothetical protein
MATYTNTRNRNSGAKVAIAGFALAIFFLALNMVAVQECNLFHSLAWVASALLRPAISAAWQLAPAHLCEGSSLLQQLLQIVASVRPLLCVIAG